MARQEDRKRDVKDKMLEFEHLYRMLPYAG